MASGFRFDPPPVEVGTDLRWLLARAFGPVEFASTIRGSLNPSHIFELAESFDLSARVGARTPHSILIEELGEEAADSFLGAHRQTAIRSLVVEQLCRGLAGVACELDIPAIFLKGAALQLAEHVPTGARGMTDIDLLTLNRDAPRLQQQVKEAGWTVNPGPSGEHQLQVLTHRSGLSLEIHTMVLGVRISGAGSASADELLTRNLAVPLPTPLQGSLVPSNSVLLAHMLVHGIAQHGLYPQSYPMSRLVADAQDLCGDRAIWDELLPTAMAWIQTDVSVEEAEAVRDLALRLGGGKAPVAIAEGNDLPALLLRHILAGVFDKQYQDALRLRSLTRPLAAQSASRTLFRNAIRTVWLTRPQVDILYGTPRTPLGYWGWRLWRPFDLVLRAVRYGWAWAGHRLRRR
jgi:hypothetical protein